LEILKRFLYGFFAVLFCVITVFCSASVSITAEETKTPKNVIIMIGDGMGFEHVAMAHKKKGSDLTMETFPGQGTSSTDNVHGSTTDSAAGGTAIACGVKVPNGCIGKKATGKTLPNIREFMVERGRKSGLVSTAAIADATPATFGAHTEDRGNEELVAKQYIDNDIDVILGGGQDYFGGELLSKAKTEKGYKVIRTKSELQSITSNKVIGLFSGKALPYYENYSKETPTLTEMTQTAINILKKNQNGFFLMVEGGMIDPACHNNLITEATNEVLEFDKAVKVAYDFAKSDGDTLVIVTADHETGGVEENGVTYQFTSKSHTSADVPVFAYGVGAEKFVGAMENIDICKKVRKLVDSSYVEVEETNTKDTDTSSGTYDSGKYDEYVNGDHYTQKDGAESNTDTTDSGSFDETTKAEESEETFNGKDITTKKDNKILIIIIASATVFLVLVGVEAFFLVRYIKKRKNSVSVEGNTEETTETEITDTDIKTE